MARSPKRGRRRLFLGVGTISGMVVSGPTGEATTIPYGSVPGAIGAGNVTGPASSTDNAIARFNGVTGKLLQNSLPLVADDGRITTLTDPSGAQDAATKNYVDGQIAAIPESGTTLTFDNALQCFTVLRG